MIKPPPPSSIFSRQVAAATCALLGLLAFPADSRAACSPYAGKVVFNEVSTGSNQFIEVKILDPAVIAASSQFADWKIAVWRNKDGGGVESHAVGFDSIYSDIGKNTCGKNSAWIKVPNADLDDWITGDLPFNFVLYDSSNDQIIDLLRLGTTPATMYPGSEYASCPAIESALPSSRYDGTKGPGASVKDWYRDPDGSGVWDGKETSNVANTNCGSNNGGGALSVTKTPSVSTTTTGSNVSYTIHVLNGATGGNIVNFRIEDNVPAGLSYVSCTPPAGGACGVSGGLPYLKPCTLASCTLGANTAMTGSFTFQASATGTITNMATAYSATTSRATASATITVTPGGVTPSGFAAYETTVSDANAPNVANQVIRTRVATASGNLCTSGGTCALRVAAFYAGAIANYSGDVSAELEFCADVSRSGGTVSCGGTWASISGSTKTVSLSNGKGSVTFGAVANSYEMVRVKISSSTVSGGPWKPSDSVATTGHFAIRPLQLGNLTATDFDRKTPGSARSLTSGGNVHNAGQFFTLSASADNGSAITTNYRATATSPLVTDTTSTDPIACSGTCTLYAGAWTSSSGTLTSSTAHYDEVGTFSASLQDQSYADVDGGDSSTDERYFSGTISGVGRFVPDHFALTGALSSILPGCPDFAYFGQPSIQILAALQAREKNGAVTRKYTAGSITVSNDNNGAAVSETLTPALPATTWTAGQYQINATDGPFALSRPSTLPAGPYANFRLKFMVTDADGVTFASGNNHDFTSALSLRLGRLALFDKTGSSTTALPLSVEAQYWDSTAGAWLKNTADSCTSVPSSAVVLAGYVPSGAPNNWATSVVEPAPGTAFILAGGGATLTLAAPSPLRSGRVNVAIHLGAGGSVNSCAVSSGGSGMNAPYLRSRYGSCGATGYDKDPAASASFGYYGRQLYRREVFN